METQNVSAQLYFKQLPEDPSSGKFGCSETGNVLSTCVNDVQTDAQIETAFQSQLDLSEYYKSPYVFDTMKRDYMDKTMEGENTPVPQEVDANVPPKPIPTPMMIPSGPRDFLNKKSSFTGKSKSFFGAESKNNNLSIFFILFLIMIVALLCVYVLKQNDNNPVKMMFGKMFKR
jgi:hypothetical protein